MIFSTGNHVQIRNVNCIVPMWRNVTGTIVGFRNDIPGVYEFSPDDKSLSDGAVLVSEENIRLLKTDLINVEDLI